MSENVKVQIELDKARAENGLRDLQRKLNATDQLISKLKESGVTWADSLSKASSNTAKLIKKLGKDAATSTDSAIKANKQFADSFNLVSQKVKKVQNDLNSLSRSFLVMQNASKIPATAGLRDDNEKRRQRYMAGLQASYQKEQAALAAHLAKKKAMEDSYKLKSLKNTMRLDFKDYSGKHVTAQLGGQRALNDLIKRNAELNRIAAAEQKKKTMADREAAQAQISKASAAQRVTTVSLAQAGAANRLSSAWRMVKQEWRESVSVANVVQTSMRGLTAIFARLGQGFVNLFRAAPQLSSEMLGFRNALALVTGNQKEASTLLNTAVSIAKNLKLSIIDVTRQYSKFTNAATIAGLTVQEATSTFEDFAVAARVLNLNQERTAGMFLALEQMISKGTVSMEELRRQLGEHIPGAMNLAAQAMGYGTDELAKFIKEVANGNVNSVELVTNLSKLVRERTEPQLASSLTKFSAELQAAANAVDLLRLKIGDALSPFLGQLLRGFTAIIEKITEWIPLNTVLGDSTNKLATSLDSVKEVASTISTTIDVLKGDEEALAKANEAATTSFENLAGSMESASIASVMLMGTVGTAGLGGAMAALKKGLNIVKAGLIAFIAPFGKVFSVLAKLKVLIGAGTAGVIGALAKLTAYLKGAAYTLGLFAFANPFTAVVAGATAAGVAVAALIDDAEDFDNAVASAEGTYKKVNKASKALLVTAEALTAKMADAGQAELAAALALQVQSQEIIDKNIQALQEENNLLKEQFGIWDWINEKVGVTTDNAQEIAGAIRDNEAQMELLRKKTEQVDLEMAGMVETAKAVTNQLKMIDEIFNTFLEESDIRQLEIELAVERGSMTELQGAIAQIRDDAAIERTKHQKEAGGTRKIDPAVMARIDREEELAIALEQTKAANKALQKQEKELDAIRKKALTAIRQQEESLKDSIAQLQLQNKQIGMNEEELAKSNAAAEIAAINEKILALETQATTAAMRTRVATMKEQVGLLASLKQQNIELTQQEKARREAMQEYETMRKNGQTLLKQTLSLEEQYAIRVRELVPQLKAAGATQKQVATIMQQEWAKIVDSSNNGLRSVESIAEEVAQNMQRSFSDFFFDVMDGNFNDMVGSFQQALQRMIADAAASQLSSYLMQGATASAGGGGIFGTIVNTLATGLGGAGSAPAIAGSNIMQSSAGSGMFVNLPGVLHKGGIVGTEAMPRYHGGIGPREQPAILNKDEGVFTPGQMASLASMQDVKAAAGGGATVINFNPQITVDARGADSGVANKVRGAVRGEMQKSAGMLEAMNNGMRLSTAQQGSRLDQSIKNANRNK